MTPSAPRSPGWYPDAVHSGQERWWNGVSWSESRRPAGGGPVISATTSLPPVGSVAPARAPDEPMWGRRTGRVPAPPNPFSPSPADALRGSSRNPMAVLGFVLAVISLVIGLWVGTGVLGVVAGVLSAQSLRRAQRTGGAGRLLGILGVVIGFGSVFALGPLRSLFTSIVGGE